MSDFHDPLKDVDPFEYIEQRKRSYETALQEFEQIFIAKKNIMTGDLVYLKDVEKSEPEPMPKSNYVLEDGTELKNVHPRTVCEGQPCAIHHASDHPLATKNRSWQLEMVWRTCNCGTDHPDYDSIAFIIDRDGSVRLSHDCCDNKCCGIPDWVEISA